MNTRIISITVSPLYLFVAGFLVFFTIGASSSLFCIRVLFCRLPPSSSKSSTSSWLGMNDSPESANRQYHVQHYTNCFGMNFFDKYQQVFTMWRKRRVVQRVRSLDLTTHTNLSQIRRGLTLSFVHYKKGSTRLAAASDKVYQLLVQGRWFSLGTLTSSTTKTGRHDIAEILLKVALSTKIQIRKKKRKGNTYHALLKRKCCLWCLPPVDR